LTKGEHTVHKYHLRLFLFIIDTMKNLRMLLILCFPIFVLGLVTCDNSMNTGIISSWVQAGPNGITIARVITHRDNCPEIRLNGVGVQMEVRHSPDNDFPVLVCEIIIPQGTITASVEGRALKLPVENPKRLVVIADTGCRLETGDVPQSCNDPQAWPFERIAKTAASFNPDLVVHVGDYFYREDPCPPGDKGCEGSPFGDNYASWDADFFSPANKLLSAAPWAFTRGNHEECSRGGKGWFTFLDPNPPFEDCQEFTPPYVIDIGLVNLLMLDSSAAKDNSAPADMVEAYTSQIATLENASGDNAWFVTHHPFWGIGEDSGELFMINDTLQAASGNILTGGINLVLSAHIHLFEMLNFEGSRQPQFVIGMSGTELDPPVTKPLVGVEIGGATVAEGIVLNNQFGFALMELEGDVWHVSIRGVGGGELLTCEIDGALATCFP
jgi:hypothetical protein